MARYALCWSLLLVFGASPAIAAETEVRYLSGQGPEDAVQWDFYATAGRNARVWSKIKVPSCWELQGFGTYNYGGSLIWNDEPFGNEQGLYRYEFSVPAAWQGKVVRIVFDGAMTDTTVWINGQPAGPSHIGGFYRFHYDISALLKYGDGKKNLLEVTVAKVSANRSVNEAERAADYWVFGGIFRPVWLEALPKQFIDWTAIDADADGSFSAHVNLGAPATAAAEITARVLDAEGKPVGSPLTATVAIGDAKAELRGKFDGVKRWTAETPNLYSVKVTASFAGPASRDDAAAHHAVTERFGFRTIEVRENDGVYLNGTKIVLKGINRHCFWPETGRTVSREQSYADVRLIKEANMNAVRMSHYPPDRHFLEACDELGLYVLDELAGWQKAYTKAVGRRLIGEMIRRDVNHPAIVFWDNGNEGGWNVENDDQFDVWDPQKRPVLHPWEKHGGIDTNHYEKYASTVKLSAGPMIFMPTEFLHGLYDGGIGAGFRDYWDVMGKSPTVAGGFFWVFADEGVVRSDQNGRIDNAGNQAPDGIVGPHREKEGSFFAIKEIWSPIQIGELRAAPDGFLATVTVQNGFDFTDLASCSFEWRLIKVTPPGDRKVIARGVVGGPAIAPRAQGELRFDLSPASVHRIAAGTATTDEPINGNQDWRFDAQILQLSARYPDGREMWTWSWPLWKTRRGPVLTSSPGGGAATATIVDSPQATTILVRRNTAEYRFSKTTGRLTEVRTGGREFTGFANGPRLVAYRRDGRKFSALPAEPKLVSVVARESANGVVTVEGEFEGALRRITWTISDELALNYEYTFEGAVDLLGVAFELPERNVQSKRWLGAGPYRVYRNRREGGVLDVHEVAFNDPVPGQTFAYPEFKGYFRDWQWITLQTTAGELSIQNLSGVPFLGLYGPRDGEPSMLAFPNSGISFLDVIPAIGTKFDEPEVLGPQSQTPNVKGTKTGTVVFRFGSK